MTAPASYDDPDFRAHESAVGRRRVVAAVVTVLALSGLAGGAAVGAEASSQNERAEHSMSVDLS